MERVGKRYGDGLGGAGRLDLGAPGRALHAARAAGMRARPRCSGCSRASPRPTTGRIVVDDEPIDAVPPEAQHRHGVLSRTRSGPTCRCSTTWRSACARAASPRDAIAPRSGRRSGRSGSRASSARRPSELSGGQPQRVALARALVVAAAARSCSTSRSHRSSRPCARRCASSSLRLHNELGITTIYATRDQAEALALSTRIAVLSGGDGGPGGPAGGDLLAARETASSRSSWASPTSCPCAWSSCARSAWSSRRREARACRWRRAGIRGRSARAALLCLGPRRSWWRRRRWRPAASPAP